MKKKLINLEKALDQKSSEKIFSKPKKEMKTINEEKDNVRIYYANSSLNILGVSDGAFQKGVEFAQRWIPVEEELPEKKNSNFSDLVLTKNKFNNILLERYDFEYKHFNSIRHDSKEVGDGQVTHWRPIELF